MARIIKLVSKSPDGTLMEFCFVRVAGGVFRYGGFYSESNNELSATLVAQYSLAKSLYYSSTELVLEYFQNSIPAFLGEEWQSSL